MTFRDLAVAVRKAGLRVVELDGWETNVSAGGFAPRGVLCHHTGSYDAASDADDDLSYARWLAFTGRPDLDPPLCNLALSAEGVVYVCSSGNANHAGEARASGPMPAASDGNALYLGIEAMNSGSQGWTETQYNAYVMLAAALCEHYGWPASHVRGHKETSVTGKVDPSGSTPHGSTFDMDRFRADVARAMRDERDWLDMATEDEVRAIVREELDAVLDADMNEHDPKGSPEFRGVTLRTLLKRIGKKVGAV